MPVPLAEMKRMGNRPMSRNLLRKSFTVLLHFPALRLMVVSGLYGYLFCGKRHRRIHSK
jgi:hypothetical protein